MNLRDQMMLWNQVYIRIIDIRVASMGQGEALRSYLLPSSAFFYVIRGKATVSMDGTPKEAGRFHVLHGGKGLCLDVEAEEALEYGFIFYKAVLPLKSRPELIDRVERDNPFRLQYAFAPTHPLALHGLVEAMASGWRGGGGAELLRVRTTFYQFVSELLAQMEERDVRPTKPDLAEQAARYLKERYKEPITLDSLAAALDCNPRQLLRLFKSGKRTSPIDYLIRVRMDRAKELLRDTDCTLREIAESVGYSDSYYFSRMFKKLEGTAPTVYQERARSQRLGRAHRPHNPLPLSAYPIAARRARRYIENDHDIHSQYVGGKRATMHRNRNRTFRSSMAAAMLLCILVLASACGAGGNANSNASSAPETAAATASQASASASPAGASAEATRVVKHAMGETELTGVPQRVVILTNEGTEALLALGVKPIGAVSSWVGDPWYDFIKDDMQDVTVVGDELQPNLELIAGLKPDLIVGNKARQEKIYEQLKEIAPTVFSEDLGGDWKTNFKLYSEAVGKQAEGEAALAAYEERIASLKEKLGDKLSTQVSVVRFSASQVRIYQKQSFSGAILNELGFARPASQDKDSSIEVMSKETIPSMDGDVLFYFVTRVAGKNDADLVVKEWQDDPLFRNLNAAKANKVIEVDEAIWNSSGGIEAANLLLDELEKYFEAN
ncbi:AraC family transcriptional regulator [Cohnella fermenti]|uniref:Helix-turn-helix domain-containing protein n=1 Tax=Cohnella fermenti TaxID=2565925 RepID=A0A4S4BMB7_9BACL|nr:AraC family transcriptional regulator [Cohnella fermenti]THF75766.1 helix-turn-helix domain-containing protein [Cohnella fermenti]